jgi:hypothetical protein
MLSNLGGFGSYEISVSLIEASVDRYKNVPHLLIAAKPPTSKPKEMRRRGLLKLHRDSKRDV